MTRALLTDREREILRGDATDVKHPDKYRSNTRGRIRERLDRLEDDIELIAEHEPELANKLRETIFSTGMVAPMDDVIEDIQVDIQAIRDEIEN
jgi:hypothetical protein